MKSVGNNCVTEIVSLVKKDNDNDRSGPRAVIGEWRWKNIVIFILTKPQRILGESYYCTVVDSKQ